MVRRSESAAGDEIDRRPKSSETNGDSRLMRISYQCLNKRHNNKNPAYYMSLYPAKISFQPSQWKRIQDLPLVSTQGD